MKRFAFCVVIGLCLTAGLCGGRQASAQSKDEQQIKANGDMFASAVKDKDVDRIMKFYVPTPDLFVFDLGVPRQHEGWDDYKKDWQDLFATIKGPVNFEIQDMSVESDGKLAFSHCIQHGSWVGANGNPVEIFARVSDVYRKVDGKWLIIEEHVSVPINMATGKPDMLSQP